RYGILEGGRITEIRGSIYGRYQRTRRSHALPRVRLLPPCEPTKIVAVGLNYRDHAAEFGHPVPDEPILFLKPLTALIGPGDKIVYPAISQRVDYEAELAIVMKRKGRNIPRGQALRYVLGYTCHNDVTARDLQKKDGQWTRAKSFDTFAPLGPCIATGLDPHRLHIEARVNGEIRQSFNSDQLIFDVPTLVAFVSQVMTLSPGDVIATGTPPGVGPLKRGDVVEVEIEGIGVLRNRVG
ncbi:MAG: fumarylacetoacetate hydrolase family protein, partial [Candidatus Methylomirabilales bacterium]